MNGAPDPSVRSWVDHPENSDFPIQNLPFGGFSIEGRRRDATAIGEQILDLAALHDAGLFADTPIAHENVFDHASLNAFMEKVWAIGTDPAIDPTGLFNVLGIADRTEFLELFRTGYTDPSEVPPQLGVISYFLGRDDPTTIDTTEGGWTADELIAYMNSIWDMSDGEVIDPELGALSVQPVS